MKSLELQNRHEEIVNETKPILTDNNGIIEEKVEKAVVQKDETTTISQSQEDQKTREIAEFVNKQVTSAESVTPAVSSTVSQNFQIIGVFYQIVLIIKSYSSVVFFEKTLKFILSKTR